MAAVQPKSDMPPPPPPAPSAAAAVAAAPARSRSSRKLPRPGTFSHARLPRTPSVPRGRSYHGKPLSAAAHAAQQGYFARKAAKLYAERKKAVSAGAPAAAGATAAAPAGSPHGDHVAVQADMSAALKAANHNQPPVDVINITVDAQGVKIDENKPRLSAALAPRNNSRARMTRSSSRQRNVHGRTDDKENFVTDARLDAHIEAYFIRKRASVASVAAAVAPPTTPADSRVTEHSATSNHSWDGSMPKRRNSRSVIERDHAISQRVSPSLNAKPGSAAVTARQAGLSESCELNKVDANEAVKQSCEAGTQSSCAEVPSSGKWCDECAGVGLHISALLSELQTQRPVPEAGAADMSSSCSGSGAKKGWKSVVTQTVLGDSKSRSSSEKAKLQQEINVLRATVDFLYKKIERVDGNDSTSATSASSR